MKMTLLILGLVSCLVLPTLSYGAVSAEAAETSQPAAGPVTQVGPEPDPWWLQVDKTQGLLLKWITALGVVLTALIGMVGGIFLLFKSKMNELKERQDRQTEEKQALTDHVVEMARSLPPPKTGTGLLVLALALPCFFGCATDTGDVNKDRAGRVTNAILENVAKAVGRVAVSTLTNAATAQLSGNKVDLAQSASAGLWQSAGSIVDADSVQSVINAWSGGAIKPVAEVAKQKFVEANPKTPAEKAAVVDAIATGISTATGAKPGG